MYKHFFKRVISLFLAICGLVVCAIPMVIIAIVIKCDSKGPALFKQKRLGKGQKPFTVYKFRTMCQGAFEKGGVASSETDSRITKVGAILRRTSLDELPQMFSIFKGDMSIVGPRPVVDDEIEKYGMAKDRFLSVTPGLTGWWACNGRSCTSYADRIMLELYYVNNRSFMLDMKCIFKTVIAVIKRDGAK